MLEAVTSLNPSPFCPPSVESSPLYTNPSTSNAPKNENPGDDLKNSIVCEGELREGDHFHYS